MEALKKKPISKKDQLWKLYELEMQRLKKKIHIPWQVRLMDEEITCYPKNYNPWN